MLLWPIDRPPILDVDFTDDHAAGERARDVWYERRRRPADPALPVIDPLANEAVQKHQRHERSVLWKKMLRRYNNAQRDRQRDPQAEAQRKRSARLLTNIRAGLGDTAADVQLDAEVHRGKRRRLEARERALELRHTVDGARALRAQLQVQAVARRDAMAWALERRPQPKYRENAPEHYAVLHALAKAHHAVLHPPDGSARWDAAAACAAADAQAESEAVRAALLDWGRYFDPEYVEPWPHDPYGYYHDHVPGMEHFWARAPVPLPSVLLCWLQRELHAPQPTKLVVAATPAATEELDDEELQVLDAEEEAEEATWEGDLELALADEEEEASSPPPPRPRTWWYELSRAEKAMARLLGFRWYNWRREKLHEIVSCPWSELCDEERVAAQRIGFHEAHWDMYVPERVGVPAPSAEDADAARRWVAVQLARTRRAELKFQQVCAHPFNAAREPPRRVEPAASEPDSPYYAALTGSLYDVHGPCALPPFVRPFRSRRSMQNPEGYCREHGCTYRTPINPDPGYSAIFHNNSCDCTIGAPGLEPCDVCGGGLSSSKDKQCHMGVCREVMRCYVRLCLQLEDGLSKAERAQEREREAELTRVTGQYHVYPQERHFLARVRGIESDMNIE